MKAKTLKQITSQSSRITLAIAMRLLSDAEKLSKIREVRSVSHRYEGNVLRHLREAMSVEELNEYWAITPVPASVYAKKD